MPGMSKNRLFLDYILFKTLPVDYATFFSLRQFFSVFGSWQKPNQNLGTWLAKAKSGIVAWLAKAESV